jgi:hypothetical protein
MFERNAVAVGTGGGMGVTPGLERAAALDVTLPASLLTITE